MKIIWFIGFISICLFIFISINTHSSLYKITPLSSFPFTLPLFHSSSNPPVHVLKTLFLPTRQQMADMHLYTRVGRSIDKYYIIYNIYTSSYINPKSYNCIKTSKHQNYQTHQTRTSNHQNYIVFNTTKHYQNSIRSHKPSFCVKLNISSW